MQAWAVARHNGLHVYSAMWYWDSYVEQLSSDNSPQTRLQACHLLPLNLSVCCSCFKESTQNSCMTALHAYAVHGVLPSAAVHVLLCGLCHGRLKVQQPTGTLLSL